MSCLFANILRRSGMSCVECVFFTPFFVVFITVALLADILLMIFACRLLALFCECFGLCEPCWVFPFSNPAKSDESSRPICIPYNAYLPQPPGITANSFQNAMANAPPLEPA